MQLPPRATLTAALVLLLPALPSAPAAASQEEIVWDKLERGILYTAIRAEQLTDEGPLWVHVYNVDTYRYSLAVHDCMDLPEGRPLSFDEWYRLTDSPLLFNVMPEPEEKHPRGYLRLSGTTVWGAMNDAWKGILAMGPEDGSPPLTRIIDTETTPFDPLAPGFADALQAPVLLDETGTLRVSPRDYRATRAAIGEDGNGNLLIFLTEGACTLWEMARWLQQSPFSLSRALSVGVGNEPQVLGRFAPQRIYVVGEAGQDAPGSAGGGAILRELSSERPHCWILGLEPVSR